MALGTDLEHAEKVVAAFKVFIAEPVRRKFANLTGYDVAKRNPFVYAAFGLTDAREWADRVLADMLSSSAEGLMGNWMEEVARIICDGTKPGSGVDLQRDRADGVVELYAIQSTTNTKNAGGRRSDIQGMEAAAGALRAQRRHVDMFVAYLFGRKTTTQLGHITHLSSAEFWERLTGDEAFLQGLLSACTVMSSLYVGGSAADRARVSDEAAHLFGDASGRIDWGKVLLLRRPSSKRAATESGRSDRDR
jgi:hypothetical protein